MRRINLRVAGIFIIIAVLFSYLPMDAMGNCSEEDHSTNKRMDCGYAFHCPIIYDPATPQLLTLSINGRLRWMPTVEKVEELPRPIFIPPETFSKICSKGMKELATMIADKIYKEFRIED